MRLPVAAYNIHKGVSHLRRRPKMPELRISDHVVLLAELEIALLRC
ncbi:MAG: hypothetical protein LBI16_00365 [Burkholderiales bacterium]|jgi:endonuclease/exonuclease/phosphatase family metal-dependent hydrolase|nr:hypothetical protein [Burkholderiales bacterium]